MGADGRKSIFITGAASGIGLATAKRFAREGWFVGLADIDATGLKLAQGEIGAGNCSTHKLDVLCPEAASEGESFTTHLVRPPDGMKEVSAPLEPGDCLFFNGCLIHGSQPNRSTMRLR